MSLFQRIKTPFTETAEEDEYQPPPRSRAIGELLRARREQLDLQLDPIGEALRIKPAYLAALEQGRIEELPGPAYAMGFVRAYAEHLGLDGDRVLARYKADTAEINARPDLTLPVPLGERSLPGGPILLIALILAVCGYGTWYYLSTDERARPERVAAVPADLRAPDAQTVAPALPAQQPAFKAAASPPGPDADTPTGPKPTLPLGPGPDLRTPAPDSSLPSLAANPAAVAPAAPPPATRPGGASPSEPIVFPGSTPAQTPMVAPSSPASPAAAPAAQPTVAIPAASTASATATPIPASGSVGSTPGGAVGGDARVALRALADCWIQVRASDQSIVFSRVLKAGEVYHVPGRTGLALRTGNAGALAVEVDGKPVPPIGPIGTLRRNVALDPDSLAAGTAVHG
ncbi:MAG TPA: RodZ domain-containing protein [Stellaceae bacterium]|nr:RodZ domain-containing protein [Stellaceae bacterium]